MPSLQNYNIRIMTRHLNGIFSYILTENDINNVSKIGIIYSLVGKKTLAFKREFNFMN